MEKDGIKLEAGKAGEYLDDMGVTIQFLQLFMFEMVHTCSEVHYACDTGLYTQNSSGGDAAVRQAASGEGRRDG